MAKDLWKSILKYMSRTTLIHMKVLVIQILDASILELQIYTDVTNGKKISSMVHKYNIIFPI